jgi:hypothetical protein
MENMYSLGSQFRSEVTNNPKKACFIGILLLVGLYFLVPLLWERIGKAQGKENSPDAIQTTEKTASGRNESANVKISDNTSTFNKPAWKDVIKLMSNDPRTLPAEPLTMTRDPFEESKRAVGEKKKEEQAKEDAPIVSPASLGLRLTSILIGAQNKIARISGKIYKEGQMVEVVQEGRHYRFVLNEIQDRQVILESEGERFKLSIPDPGKSQRMVVGEGGDF